VEHPENVILAAVLRLGLMIHKKLGPGLFESVYEAILAHELRKEGFKVLQQVEAPLEWDGLMFDKAFRVDLLVDGIVVVEIKAVEKPHPIHARQLRTHLKLMNLRLGAVVNFGLETFKEGFERIANGMPD
jgi:iron complex transport system substrate-binding protein